MICQKNNASLKHKGIVVIRFKLSKKVSIIGLYRDVWIAAIAWPRTSLETHLVVTCTTSQCKLRSFRNGERNLHCDIAHITTKRVSSLTLDCNGVSAIKAYRVLIGEQKLFLGTPYCDKNFTSFFISDRNDISTAARATKRMPRHVTHRLGFHLLLNLRSPRDCGSCLVTY